MKHELIKQFVKKIIRKILIFAIVMFIVASIFQSVSPIVTNNMALGQMQNSDEMFILMNTYNKIRPMVNLVYLVISALFVHTLGRDTYQFVKTINIENNMEEN